MFCGKCGASLPDDAVKCSECGAPVKIRSEAADLKKAGQTFFKAPESDELDSRKDAAEEISSEQEAGISAARSGQKKSSAASSARKTNKKKNASGTSTSRKTGKKSSSKSVSSASVNSPEDLPGAGRVSKKTSESVQEHTAGKKVSAKTESKEPAAAEDVFPERSSMQPMSKEEYLDSLPLAEKIRRKVQESMHRYEEAADVRKMRRHLERAAKYYNEDLEEEEKVLKPVPDKTAQVPAAEKRTSRTISSDRIREEIAEQAARERAEKVRSRLADAGSAGADLTVREKEASSSEERTAATETYSEEAGDTKPSFRELSEESDAIEKAEEKTEEKTAPETAGPAVSGIEEETSPAHLTQDKNQEEPDQLKTLSAGDLPDIKIPQEAAAVEEVSQMETPVREQSRLAEEPGKADAETGLSDRELLTLARRALAEQEAAARNNREQRMEDARIVRRYQEDMPDDLDQALSRYGLSKDAAVRLATLFLIAVLSMVYVLGRGHQPSSLEDVPVAGDGMTGAPAYSADPDAGEAVQEETPEEEESAEDQQSEGEDSEEAGQ